MKRYYVTDRFDIGVLRRLRPIFIRFLPITLEEARNELEGVDVVSAIENPDTAHAVSALLKVELSPRRANFVLNTSMSDGILIAHRRHTASPPEGFEFWVAYWETDLSSYVEGLNLWQKLMLSP